MTFDKKTVRKLKKVRNRMDKEFRVIGSLVSKEPRGSIHYDAIAKIYNRLYFSLNELDEMIYRKEVAK